MAKVLSEGQAYAGRRADAAVHNFTLDREAAALLRQYAGQKRLGELVARLIYQHHERELERQRVRKKLTLVLKDESE